MGRPKGSKNKPKNNKVKVINPVIIKGDDKHITDALFEEAKLTDNKTLFHWNETIQKLNEMKEKGDWTEVPTVIIDTVPETVATMTSTNKIKEEVKEEFKEEPKKKGKSIKSDDDKYPHCERCGCVVKYEPWRADLNVLTGRADYHRQTPRYVKLCSTCSMELSDVVDKWLIEGGCKKKFEY